MYTFRSEEGRNLIWVFVFFAVVAMVTLGDKGVSSLIDEALVCRNHVHPQASSGRETSRTAGRSGRHRLVVWSSLTTQ